MSLDRYGKKNIGENALLAVWTAIHDGCQVLALEKPTSKEKWFILSNKEQTELVSSFPAEFDEKYQAERD
jgi:hypothetical protein